MQDSFVLCYKPQLLFTESLLPLMSKQQLKVFFLFHLFVLEPLCSSWAERLFMLAQTAAIIFLILHHRGHAVKGQQLMSLEIKSISVFLKVSD